MAWVEAITHNRVYEEGLDAERFREAFRTLAATRKTWPTPAEFVEAIPPRKEWKQLPANISDPAKVQAMIDALAKELRADTKIR